MDTLVVVVNKTHKLSEIIRKYICQASPAMKYNDIHIEHEKSKGGRSVKVCIKYPISVFITSCINYDSIELEIIIDPALFQKTSPKDAFSTMVADSTTKRTTLTSKFSVFNVEEFHIAYKTATNKEHFLKIYATGSWGLYIFKAPQNNPL